MYLQETLQTPITEKCDVLVAGGGIAGIAAALSSARLGAKTILLERSFLLGGLATAGLVTIYLPLCDGRGHQVSFGIAEELLRLSISLGAEADYPHAWLSTGDSEARKTQRFQVRYNAQIFALLVEELLKKSGVEIRYGTTVVAMQTSGRRAECVICESKSGREAIAARSFVDATGDADLFYLSGASTQVFKAGNPLAAWYYRFFQGGIELRSLGACDVPDELQDELGAPEPICPWHFTGLNAKELSEMTCQAHAKILEAVQKDQRVDRASVPVTLSTIPQVRMTRRIKGAYTLDEQSFDSHFPDSIGKIGDWRRRGYVYELPFRILYGTEMNNLIAAGRCISVTDGMWDISRVIPACAVTGEAAGAAAALCDSFPDLDIRQLQRHLPFY